MSSTDNEELAKFLYTTTARLLSTNDKINQTSNSSFEICLYENQKDRQAPIAAFKICVHVNNKHELEITKNWQDAMSWEIMSFDTELKAYERLISLVNKIREAHLPHAKPLLRSVMGRLYNDILRECDDCVRVLHENSVDEEMIVQFYEGVENVIANIKLKLNSNNDVDWQFVLRPHGDVWTNEELFVLERALNINTMIYNSLPHKKVLRQIQSQLQALV